MTTSIKIDNNHLQSLDISPVKTVVEEILNKDEIISNHQTIKLEIDFPREETDPRELSEIPEVRLWFLALDAYYPYLPFFLDWKDGDLIRYAAMLVPHKFNRSEGIQYNHEALDIFIMQKVFVLHEWLKQQGINDNSFPKYMAQMFGYDLENSLFELLEK